MTTPPIPTDPTACTCAGRPWNPLQPFCHRDDCPVAGGECRGCGKPLLKASRTMADGCPCNSARGVNHGLVPDDVCTCAACDPAQTGSSRIRKPSEREQAFLGSLGSVTTLDSRRPNTRRPNTRRAYLVAHMNTKTSPPIIIGTGLYSESASSLSGALGNGRFAFDVVQGDGHDFEAAKREILEMPMPYRSIYQWAIDILPEGER